MVLQIFLMIALRSHYTIDMFAGVIIAHYFFIISEKYVYLIDWHLLGIPLEKRMAYERRLTPKEVEYQYTRQLR